ncbi:MAG: DMT family transporter [Alphaproteobacteria bacterium]|nr:DMT family transporter [Alphaproteobacteria bacterium]
MISKTKGYILAILAVLFWSFNVIVAKYFANTFTPWQISFYRWFFASICLIPFTLGDIIKKHDIIFKNFKIIFWLSITGIVLMNTFSYIAGDTISAVEMSLIGVMGPVFIVILSRIFYDIHISLRQVWGIIISFIGVIAIVLHGKFLSSNFAFKIGDLWMLMLALSFGIYSVIMIKRPKEISQTTLLSCIILLGTTIILPFFLWDSFHHPVCDKWNLISVGALLYMGIFNSVLSYLFWNISLDTIGSLKASVIYYLMPIFSSIEAYFLLNEEIYKAQIYGGILVLIGIYLTNEKKKS